MVGKEYGKEYDKMNEAILFNMEKDAREQHTPIPIIFLAMVVIFVLLLIALA